MTVLLLSAVVLAQTPDLSGTWSLDAKRSTAVGGGRGSGTGAGGGRGGGLGLGPPPDRLTIAQTAATLTIEARAAGSTRKIVYALDGRTTTNPMPAGRSGGAPASSTAHWDQGRLVVSISVPNGSSRAGTVEYQEVWSLDTDGSLIVETTMVGQPNLRRCVYKK
ncbi:MAG: hypothetical protein ACHQO8_03945 [Vicinamibacterales bacterium]